MRNASILLVEDERRIADTLEFGLTENNYEVHTAYQPDTALDLFQVRPFDLVILDVNLPGMNGFELCRLIRVLNEQVPVLLLTAVTAIDHKVEGYEAGADDYLPKPFEFRELIMKIRVLLRRTTDRHFPTGNILRAADLSLNLETMQVYRNEKEISLTARELKLLEYLLRNKNRTVSRADIAINVWDADFETENNIIDVYINYIRNKVDKPFPVKLIHTQIGMGYILKDS